MSDLFETEFKKLTGNEPFPWQRDLYESWFSQGKFPTSCNIPTGLGKTSVIAVWLIALAQGKQVPKRLVYVVNRRTVVDQTTEEVEKYKANLPTGFSSLGVSTLRGQFADNREWSADPSVPAVICGTVDMIGSRLLFSGYGLGFKSKPLHAGFLGQDVLIIHDEAHLEPAFQTLLEGIQKEQSQSKDFLPFHVMELTATSRKGTDAFELTDKDTDHAEIQKRMNAVKKLTLIEEDEKNLAEKIITVAKAYEGKKAAVLIFVRKVSDVKKIVKKLPKDRCLTLSGTMRGHERDGLIEKPLFQRFLPKATGGEDTVYLVCTSAGEVGVNISADHLVCDLSTYESMAQRFGRVNRFGLNGLNGIPESEITVIYPDKFADDAIDTRRKLTLDLMGELNGSASPSQLRNLDDQKKIDAFSPTPTILHTTDIVFDRWSLTTIQDTMPGRPNPEPYLHGITEDQIPDTTLAWRDEVEVLPNLLKIKEDTQELVKIGTEILDEYTLKPHELLRDASNRVFDWLKEVAPRAGQSSVWLLSQSGQLSVTTIPELLEHPDEKENIFYKTIILPPSIGGLSTEGTLEGDEEKPVRDVADAPDLKTQKELRKRVWNREDTKGMKVIFEFEQKIEDDSEETEPRTWYFCELPYSVINPSAKSKQKSYPLQRHLDDAQKIATDMVEGLSLPDNIKKAVILAAQFHDLGKARKLWQRGIGNTKYPESEGWAKSGFRISKQENHHYRHEFGSLLDVITKTEFTKLDEEMRELVLHLIAAHHGRARPHFPEEEAYDPDAQQDLTDLIISIPRRFAKLQRKYGRWGLAYLESLVRAVDIKASQEAEKAPKKEETT